MSAIIAYIGLGSNLTQPSHQLTTARAAIANLPQVKELACSSFYLSPPMGPQDQPDYVNAVLAIETHLSALDLLRYLQAIETQQGRVRLTHWGARTLDLDILLYGEQTLHLPELIIPHLGIAERAFVLYPLQEIAPTLIIPNLGAITDLVAQCPLAGLTKLA